MGEDFFQYLPSEIIVDILSRLHTRDAMACKFVCKPWLVLLATPEFVNSHISRSIPGLAFKTHSKSYDVIDIVDEFGLDFDEEYHWEASFNFKLPFDEPIHSSANGLIFLGGVDHGDLILCNPVTRDYITLPSPRQTTSKDQLAFESFGFGVSRTTGQYKVVRIFLEKPLLGEYIRQQHDFKNECQVYTAGTGMWRKVPSDSPHRFYHSLVGLLFNGNLHWRVIEKDKDDLVERISCLDLETELFSTFHIPPRPPGIVSHCHKMPFVLRDCLCLSYVTDDLVVVIWSMKEYGDEKSWTKEVLTGKVFRQLYEVFYACVIRIFENGDILMDWDRKKLFYYSSKTKSCYDLFSREDHNADICTTLYASSFLSLKNFAMENVSSF
ncbi:F-box protein At3g07870-like [Salvia splendens]|uniref:F-box protein At3g07870-like n=1 Tax=Salvia splendens TaxID=180675 RepID=UPI001C257E84|nr:F-box protein At3g07870-like [Salvia splendens]